ncbi:MAG: hypothetical protein K2J13_02485, partial [Clostridia bacterium]|nr:hypothetical protein [Clostridia bacterium]
VCDSSEPQAIENIKNCESYVISTVKKGEAVEKDIANLIYDLKVDGNVLYMRLASGNANLRADSFIEHINSKFACNIKTNDIVRTAQLLLKDGVMTDVGDILK